MRLPEVHIAWVFDLGQASFLFKSLISGKRDQGISVCFWRDREVPAQIEFVHPVRITMYSALEKRDPSPSVKFCKRFSQFVGGFSSNIGYSATPDGRLL
jgi:hypothetical protein